MLARNRAGNTVRPMTAMTSSTASICTMPATSMMITPSAIGSGAKTFQVASTSAFALDSSCPDGWRWCHERGSRRYCRVTWRRKSAPTLYIVTPAATRRITTPRTLRSTTPAIHPPIATSWAVVAWPASTAGVM